jgi:hypothetical protein
MTKPELIALTNAIRDSTLVELSAMRRGDGFNITMAFDRLDGSTLKLSLHQVQRFSAEIDNSIGFYVVSHCKIFALDAGYYLSLDPRVEGYAADEGDNFVVICAALAVT